MPKLATAGDIGGFMGKLQTHESSMDGEHREAFHVLMQKMDAMSNSLWEKFGTDERGGIQLPPEFNDDFIPDESFQQQYRELRELAIEQGFLPKDSPEIIPT